MSVYNVATVAELKAAIAAAPIAGGHTINVAAGTYVGVRFGRAFLSEVVIQPADPMNPPVFYGGITLDNPTRFVTFQGCKIDISGTTAYFGRAILIYGGSDLKFISNEGYGKVFDNNDRWGYFLVASNVVRLTATHNILHDLNYGFALSAIDNLVIEDNDLTEIAGDAINIGGIVTGSFQRNRTEHLPLVIGSTAHRDAFQHQAPGTIRASSNLTVKDNLLVGVADGTTTQGIFMGSENGSITETVLIQGNIILNTGYASLAFGQMNNVTVTGNHVRTERAQQSRLQMGAAITNATVTNNLANAFINVTAGQNGNVLDPVATHAQIIAEVDAWLASFRGGAAPAPPPVEPPVEPPPAPAPDPTPVPVETKKGRKHRRTLTRSLLDLISPKRWLKFSF